MSGTIISRSYIPKPNQRNFIIIPNYIVESFIHYSHLPEIIEPENWDDNELNQYMKNLKDIKNGVSNVKVSTKVKKVLSKLQKKVFKVNCVTKNLD